MANSKENKDKMERKANGAKARNVMRGNGFLEGDGVSQYAAHADHKHEDGGGGGDAYDEQVFERNEDKKVTLRGFKYAAYNSVPAKGSDGKLKWLPGGMPKMEKYLPTLGAKDFVYFDKSGVYYFDGDNYVKIAGNGPEGSDVAPPPVMEEGRAGSSPNFARADHTHSTKATVCFGLQIDADNPDPEARVTYLRDAAGCTPARMDFAKDKFGMGSWGDAFFMPKPCMCTFGGETDYYLEQNDLTKRADGGGSSDIANENYDGNAMMEWGKVIWYKLVPPTYADRMIKIYVADQPLDDDYRCWSFYNLHDRLVPRIYTPIYSGSFDAQQRIRSLSGMGRDRMVLRQEFINEMGYAKMNNPDGKEMWHIESYADFLMITVLSWMISKSTAPIRCFGTGYAKSFESEANAPLKTGTMDKKGMFYGDQDGNTGMKLFGMENYWGNLTRRYAGLFYNKGWYKYKMTNGTLDGSKAIAYNIDGKGYINADTFYGGFIKEFRFSKNGSILPLYPEADHETYYTEAIRQVPKDVKNLVMVPYHGHVIPGEHYGGLWGFDIVDEPAKTNQFTTAAITCRPEH